MKLTDQQSSELIFQDYRRPRNKTTAIEIREAVPKMGTVSAKFLATKEQAIDIIKQLRMLFYISTEELVIKDKKMLCVKYNCRMGVQTCLKRQENAQKRGGHGQSSVDPGCVECELGKLVKKGR